MANTFDYDNLTCESLSNYLHEAGWKTLPTIVQDAINSRKGLKIPANGSDIYFLWNTAQDTFVYVDTDPSVSSVSVSDSVELYNHLYDFYADLSSK